jgi:hypothetical protein
MIFEKQQTRPAPWREYATLSWEGGELVIKYSIFFYNTLIPTRQNPKSAPDPPFGRSGLTHFVRQNQKSAPDPPCGRSGLTHSVRQNPQSEIPNPQSAIPL